MLILTRRKGEQIKIGDMMMTVVGWCSKGATLDFDGVEGFHRHSNPVRVGEALITVRPHSAHGNQLRVQTSAPKCINIVRAELL